MQVVCADPALRGRRQALPHVRSERHKYEGEYLTNRLSHASDLSHPNYDCRGDRLSASISLQRVSRGSLARHSKDNVYFRHFVKAADQSCRLEEGCSSARRAPSSCNDSSSFRQQSAGYVWNPGYRPKHLSPRPGEQHPCS